MDSSAGSAALLASLLAVSCGGPAPLAAPRAQAFANPDNALSTVVSFAPSAAGCAQVIASAPGEADVVTPCDPAAARSGRVVVVGLKPQQEWSHVLRLYDGARPVESEPALATTGALPDELKTVHLDVAAGTAPGYALIAYAHGDRAYALAFDGAGALRWYRAFDTPHATVGPDLKQQSNGHFTMYLGCSHGAENCLGTYVEFLATGETAAVYTPPSTLLADGHEFWLRPAAAGPGLDAFFFAYDYRLVDLSVMGGEADTIVAGHSLVHQGPTGAPDVVWSAWDSLPLTGWVEAPGPAAAATTLTDFDHTNALDFDDARGQYLVSLRNFDQVVAIDAQTSAIAWSLGGAGATLRRVGDAEGFSGQHSLRVLPGDRLLIYDNGTRRQPQSSRAVEYQLDLKAGTATQIWEYRPATPIFTPYMGSVQRLASGNTLVGFSMSGRIHEVSPDGALVWDARLMTDAATPALFYRAFRIASLYEYREP